MLRLVNAFNISIKILLYSNAGSKQKEKVMLEQTKIVLANVSFDLGLFRKELIKALKWLQPSEVAALKNWCSENFSGRFDEIATEVLHPQLSL
ncbi:hypothetical protein [Marinifilum flexuosum]|nr:hypothetical protein [Marinifilum flexuosum]